MDQTYILLSVSLHTNAGDRMHVEITIVQVGSKLCLKRDINICVSVQRKN